MEKTIKKMLKNNKGATIVFALVVFLIASIVCITIVNVALSNLSRSSARKSREQERLAVVSAANYLGSNDADIVAALDAVATTGESWTVNVRDDTDANSALSATIQWTEVDPGVALTALIESGDYSAEVRLVYEPATPPATPKWNISRFKKK